MKLILRATGGAFLLGALLMEPTPLNAAAQDNSNSQDNAAAPRSTGTHRRRHRRAHGDGTAPDNTRVNKRDRDAGEPTAGSQKENRSDRTITQSIRRAVVGDKSLSMYAHNVKIITQDGMVTLKGPVRSEEEKQAIEAKAKQVVGDSKVADQLEVKASN